MCAGRTSLTAAAATTTCDCARCVDAWPRRTLIQRSLYGADDIECHGPHVGTACVMQQTGEANGQSIASAKKNISVVGRPSRASKITRVLGSFWCERWTHIVPSHPDAVVPLESVAATHEWRSCKIMSCAHTLHHCASDRCAVWPCAHSAKARFARLKPRVLFPVVVAHIQTSTRKGDRTLL